MPGENENLVDPVSDQIRAWIIAMFKALGLGDPVFAAAVSKDGEGSAKEPPEGTKDGADPLAEARKVSLARLTAITVPQRMPTEEAIRVESQIGIIRKVIDASRTEDDLAKVETAVEKLETTAGDLRATMEHRLAKVTELSRILAGLEAPDTTYLAATEIPDLAGERVAIARDLSGLIGEKTLSSAENAIRELAGRLNIAKALANGRDARVKAVQSGFASINRPEGGAKDDYIAYDAEIPAISALATLPVGDGKIGAAETALARLKVEAARLEALFKERAERIKTAEGDLANIVLKGIDAEGGLADIEKEKGAIATALRLAKDDVAIGALEKRVVALAKIAADALGARAAKVLAAVPSLKVPTDLPHPEAKPYSDRIDEIRAASTPPIDADRLLAAVADLAKLPGDLVAVADLVADRKQRIDKARDDASKLATDPDHATKAEAEELKKLRESAALQLPAALTEKAAGDAVLAAKALSHRHAELVIAIKAREDKRTEVLKALLALVPPISATGAETVKVLKEGATLRAKIEKAETLSAIEAEDAAINALEKSVKDIEGVAAARAKAVNTLEAALTLVKSEQKNLFAGGYSKLAEMLANAEQALHAAKTLKAYETVETDVGKIAPYLNSIKGYRADLNVWRAEAEFHVKMMPMKSTKTTAPDRKKEEAVFAAKKQAMQKQLLALSKSADALAAQGKIADAKKELAKFKTDAVSYIDPEDGSTKTATYVAVSDPAAVSFPGVVKTFMADKFRIIEKAERYDIIPAAGLKKSWFDARDKGFTHQKWTEATAEIATLSADLDKCKTFIDAYKNFESLLKAAPDPSPLFTALDHIKTDCTTKSFAAAKLKVDALDTGTQKNDAAYLKLRKALNGRVNAVLAVLTGTSGNSVSDPWANAEVETDHGKRMAKLGEVELALKPCEALIDEKEKAEAKLGTLDPGKYKILENAKTLLTTGDIPGATAAYKLAEIAAGTLADYIGLLERVKAVKAGYPATALAAIKKVDDSILEAETKATTQLLDKAKDALTALLAAPEIVPFDKAALLYQSQYKATKAVHDKVLASITYPAAQVKLTAPWAIIVTTGEVDKNYVEAVELMEVHKGVLAEAKPYVDARLRATKALTALDKIADKVPAAQKLKIYEVPIDKGKLDTDLAAAEVKAAAGDFGGATKSFNDLVILAKDRMKLAAKNLETVDQGHFLEGHGPDVPIEKTLERMTTGWRPDGEYAPAIKSSQFLDIGDFMACYDLAWEEAKVKNPLVGGTTVKAGAQLQVAFKMDAGKAIGMGVEGLTRQVGYAKGEVGDTELFDTFEVTQGLDQIQAKFIFQFDPPSGTATKPITTYKDYDRLYKTHNGVDPPVGYDYPGHWALNQLLPSSG